MIFRYIVLVFLFLNLTQVCAQEVAPEILITAGDTQGLIDAINKANEGTGPEKIFIRKGPDGESEFIFTGPAEV